MTSRADILLPSRIRRKRSAYRRLVFRRLFYLQLVKIAWSKLARGESRTHTLVIRMGNLGDLVYVLPLVERLAADGPVEVATGGYPYAAFVAASPYVETVWSPFVYKPKHRALIRRVLQPFYRRVIVLDVLDADWWTLGKHMSEIFAEQCSLEAPARGAVYLSEGNRAEAGRYLESEGLGKFIYVAQVVRRVRPYRSWPLEHFHRLYELIRQRSPLPILVDTVGSDETSIPNFCRPMRRLDMLTAAAVIERASIFIGLDAGLTHVAAALGVPTVSVHVGYPPESCAALGNNVVLVRQQQPFEDPVKLTPESAFEAIQRLL